MRNFIQNILEDIRYKVPINVRSFLDRHKLLERKMEMHANKIYISYSAIDSGDLSKSLVDQDREVMAFAEHRFWEGLAGLLRYGYVPVVNTIDIHEFAKWSDAERMGITCDYIYTEGVVDIYYMEDLIKKLRTELARYIHKKYRSGNIRYSVLGKN